ncbi:hypothetical protein GX586_03425 [bacterium]|nr:hypothetical protein [bacterium]
MTSVRVTFLCAAAVTAAVLRAGSAAGDPSLLAPPSVTVIVGSARTEYAPIGRDMTYVLPDERMRTVGEQERPYYFNPRAFKVDQRLFRVHVPLRIIPRRAPAPRSATILYSFLMTTMRGVTTQTSAYVEKTVSGFPFQSVTIPLSPQGATEWTVSSDWMVDSDRSLWDPGQSVLIETSQGGLRGAQRQRSSDQTVRTVADYYFPQRLAYWSQQYGVDGRWPETSFPKLVLRLVRGNEKYAGCYIEVFAGDSGVPCAGSFPYAQLKSIAGGLTNAWVNPYRTAQAYTNRWQSRAWAAQYRKLRDPGVQAGFLARMQRQDPDDSDAAELLLRNFAERGDIERAGRVYKTCREAWPRWSEHWFRIYLGSMTDPLTRRAALMAYRRDNPSSGYVLEQLAFEFIADQRWSVAQRLLPEWERLEPSNIFVHFAIAAVLEGVRDETGARAALGQAIRSALPAETSATGIYAMGTSSGDWYLRGRNAALSGTNDLAAIYLRKALADDPRNYCAQITLGDVYLSQGVAAPAARSYDEALRIAPDHPAALAGLAAVNRRLGRAGAASQYQERLWNVLERQVRDSIDNGNWTNVAVLTRFAAGELEQQIDAMLMYARALFKLGMYEESSEALYRIAGSHRHDARLAVAWAEFLTAVNNNPNALLLAEEPVGLRQRTERAWLDAARSPAMAARARLELALMALREGDLSRAYTHLAECHRLAPSAELASWIGDICLLNAEENKFATVPGASNRTFLNEALTYYQKTRTDAGTARMITPGALQEAQGDVPPAVFLGMARVTGIRGGRDADPAALLRDSLRALPGSPELVTARLKELLRAEASAPALWIDATNTLIAARPLDEQTLACLDTLFSQRALPTNRVNNLVHWAKALLRWDTAFFGTVSNRQEVTPRIRVFTIEKDDNVRFILKEHVFAQPFQCYDWYAIRSRYTQADLQNGRTRWWRRHALVKRAYDLLMDAVDVQGHSGGEAGVLLAVVERDLGQSMLVRTTAPSDAYASFLRSCFYVSATPGSAGTSRQAYLGRAQSLVSRGIAVPSLAEVFNDIPLPGPIHDLWSLPPEVRLFYASPVIMQQLLPQSERLRAHALWNTGEWAFVQLPRLEWRPGPDRDVRWARFDRERFDWALDGERARFEIAAPPQTSMWQGAGIIPAAGRNVLPLFPSFFTKPLSGEVAGLDVQFDPGRGVHPAVSFTLSPRPMAEPLGQWRDEALTIDVSWDHPTSALVRAFSKTYRVENGLVCGGPGIVDAVLRVTNLTTLLWRVDASGVSIGVPGGPSAGPLPHKLSAFAWRNGCFIGAQTCFSNLPFGVSFDSLSIH